MGECNPDSSSIPLSRLTHRAELLGGVPIFSLDADLERLAVAFILVSEVRNIGGGWWVSKDLSDETNRHELCGRVGVERCVMSRATSAKKGKTMFRISSLR